jgi:3-methyl-2-oxobutanoate hydroxymethyltransferase
MKKISIQTIKKKKNKQLITCLTSYSKPVAEIIDKYCDIILVGDSVGMVLYGMKNTKKVTLSTMIEHAKSVKLGAKKSLVVVDMPINTYYNRHTAYKNAKKIIKMTKCDAVKLEGGRNISGTVRYLVSKGINVMGHVGLLPQYASSYKIKGKNINQKRNILLDAIALSNSGAFAIVIECVVENLAKEITNKVTVPTIGIGASKYCDGQILVIDDLIGLSKYYPKFVKKYSNVSKIIDHCVKKYCKDVKTRRFPSTKNVYKN